MVEVFGGISLREIQDSAREQSFPDNAGASPEARFLSNVSALITLRQEQGEHGGIVVFLKSDTLKTDAIKCGGTEFPLLATGNDNICNNVWLSNPVLGTAYSVDIDLSDLPNLFTRINELGLGALPALIVDWRATTPIGRFYSNGCADPEAVQAVQLTYAAITKEEIKACLDHAHSTSLVTPALTRHGHSEAIWNEPAKGWPAHRPEERIQGKIIQHLRSRFTKHKVRAEQFNDDGFSDLLVYARRTDASGGLVVVNEWLLELKALTDRTETGNRIADTANRTRVQDGLCQAIAYRNQENARNSALCCFDMREKDEGDTACFQHIQMQAHKEKVELWRWFLFRSTKAARNASNNASNSSAPL